MKCTGNNIDKVFDLLKSQMADENDRGEFDNESDLLNAVETVIDWLEEADKERHESIYGKQDSLDYI